MDAKGAKVVKDAKRAMRWISMAACAAVAGIFTSSLYIADVSRFQTLKTEESAHWARQMVSQVEALTLSAREHEEKDPVAWALGYLSQGVEPRGIRIFRTEDRVPGLPPEDFSYDPKAGVFEYKKPFPPEGDSILHVQLISGYRGFLATRTPFGNDALTVSVFFAFFGLFYGVLRWIKRPRDTHELKNDIATWTGNAKTLLLQLGTHLKTTVEGGQKLASFATRSYEALKALRYRIHGGLRSLHDARRSLEDNARISKKLEDLAMSLIVESRKLGNQAPVLQNLARDIHGVAHEVAMQSQKSSKCLETLEIELEPWSVDADLAFHSFDGIVDATHAMNDGIRASKGGILEQAKLIQDLRTEMTGKKPVKAKKTG